MNLSIRIIILIIAAISTVAASPSEYPSSTKIEPGLRLGLVHTGALSTTVEKVLGKPFYDEGTAGAGWEAWKSKEGEISVRYHRIYKGEKYLGVPVQTSSIYAVCQVHTTSPSFSTADGIHVGSDLTTIRRLYPNVHLLGTFLPQKSHNACSFYDDTKTGIAFETESESGRCRAIVIHAPGEEPRQMDDEKEGWNSTDTPK